MNNLYQKCIEFLLEKETHKVSHSNRTFFEHCVGVAKYLRIVGCDEETIIAGLLHNIYGNQYYNPNLNVTKQEVIDLVGEKIEYLINLFETTDRHKIIELKNSKLLMIYLVNEYEQLGINNNIIEIFKYIKKNTENQYSIEFLNQTLVMIKDEFNNIKR